MYKLLLTLKLVYNLFLPFCCVSGSTALYCYASGGVFTTVTDAYGSVEASLVSAGFVSHGNENSLGYLNKPPAEPACNCQLSLS